MTKIQLLLIFMSKPAIFFGWFGDVTKGDSWRMRSYLSRFPLSGNSKAKQLGLASRFKYVLTRLTLSR